MIGPGRQRDYTKIIIVQGQRKKKCDYDETS